MIETGRVAKFPATVVAATGEEHEQQVIRVGAFNVVSAGKYLQYFPDTGRLLELPRQPQARFLDSVSDLENSGAAFSTFGLDPSRGQIYRAAVQADL